MKKRMLFGSLVLGMILCAGCGGGGGGSSSSGSTGSTNPTASTTNGLNLVNSMLSDTTPITTANLTTANADFKAGMAGGSSVSTATGGYAMTLVALKAQNVLNVLNISVTDSVLIGRKKAILRGVKQTASTQSVLANRLSTARFGFLGTLIQPISTSDVQPVDSKGKLHLLQLVTPAETTSGYPTNPTYSQVYAVLQDALVGLQTVDTLLTTSSNIPSDTNPMTLTDPSNPGSTVQIGTVEMYALLASVQALESALNLVLAYNTSYSAAWANESFATTFAGSLNGSPIAAALYGPGGSFGSLNSGGKQMMGAVPTKLIAAVNTSNLAINAYDNRTGSNWVINPGTLDSSDLSSYQSGAAQVVSYLQIPQSVTVNGSLATLQLNTWFANPPTSLIALMPQIYYTTSTDGSEQIVSIESASDFPDLTFGGLFAAPITVPSSPVTTTVIQSTTTTPSVLGQLLE